MTDQMTKHTTPAEGQPSDQGRRAALGRNTAMMSALVIITRLTGFLRTWAQAYAVGVTMVASCYTLANNLHSQLNNLVAGGLLITGFMPVYMAAKKSKDEDGASASAYVSNLLTVLTLFLGIAALLCIVFAPQMVWLQSFSATSEFDSDMAVWFFRWFAFEFLLYAYSTINSGILNADRKFFWSNFAPALNNIVTSLSFLLYAVVMPHDAHLGLLVLAIGNVCGVAVQVLVQLPGVLRRGIRIRPRLDLHDPSLKSTVAIGVPSIAVALAVFVSTSVQTSFSLAVTPKGSSIMYYAQVWYAVPYSVFSVPISTALYTELSESFATGRMADFKNDLLGGMNSIVFYLVPCVFLLAIFSMPLTSIMAPGLPEADMRLIALYLSWYAPSLPFWGLSTHLQKASSAMRDMKVYTLGHLIGTVAQVIACFALTGLLGLPLVAFSQTIYYVGVIGVALWGMHAKLGHIGLRSLTLATAQALVCGVAAGAVAAVLLALLGTRIAYVGSMVGSLAVCVLAGAPAFAAMIGVGCAMRNPAAQRLLRMVKAPVVRLTRRG